MKNLVGAVCALAAITAFACSGPRAQRIDEVNIVPKPKMVDVDTSEGCFELTARTPVNLIGGDSTISYAVNLLNDLLSPSLGTPLKTQMGPDTEPLFYPPCCSIRALYSSREWCANVPLITMLSPLSFSERLANFSSATAICNPSACKRATNWRFSSLAK